MQSLYPKREGIPEDADWAELKVWVQAYCAYPFWVSQQWTAPNDASTKKRKHMQLK